MPQKSVSKRFHLALARAGEKYDSASEKVRSKFPTKGHYLQAACGHLRPDKEVQGTRWNKLLTCTR